MAERQVTFHTTLVQSGGTISRAQDNTFLFTDVSVGYWVYQSHDRSTCIQGIAPIAEIHYNTTLSQGQVIEAMNLAAPGNTTVTNMVFGLTTKMNKGKWLTLGYTAPVGGNRQFDGELRVLFNWIPGA